jgi:hypothetical protein
MLYVVNAGVNPSDRFMLTFDDESEIMSHGKRAMVIEATWYKPF